MTTIISKCTCTLKPFQIVFPWCHNNRVSECVHPSIKPIPKIDKPKSQIISIISSTVFYVKLIFSETLSEMIFNYKINSILAFPANLIMGKLEDNMFTSCESSHPETVHIKQSSVDLIHIMLMIKLLQHRGYGEVARNVAINHYREV